MLNAYVPILLLFVLAAGFAIVSVLELVANGAAK